MMGGDRTLADFVAGWELFGPATIAGTIAGMILGLLGVYVVLRRLVFLTAAITQAAGFGVALSFLFGVPPALGSSVLTVFTVLPVAFERGKPSVRRDSLLGLAYLVGAAGVLIVGRYVVQDMHDVTTLLFGSAVAVIPDDFDLIVSVGLGLLVLHAWWWRGIAAVSFDAQGAAVRGLPAHLLDLVLFASLAVAISVSTRVLGALPTFAFSVLPAMAAVRVCPNIATSLIAATAFGAISGAGGYYVAYATDHSVGACQTSVAVAIVALAEVLRSLRSRYGGRSVTRAW